MGALLYLLIAAVIMGILPSVQNGGITESTFSDEASGSILLMMLLICCCAFPVSILLSLYHTQVKRSILVEEMGVFKSLSRGLDVLMQNFIPMLIIGIVIGVAGFIINLLLTIPLLLLLLPLMISFMQGNINSWQPFMAVGLFMLCYVPVLWFINGILMTYFESVWTLAYMQVTIPQKRDSLSFEANA